MKNCNQAYEGLNNSCNMNGNKDHSYRVNIKRYSLFLTVATCSCFIAKQWLLQKFKCHHLTTKNARIFKSTQMNKNIQEERKQQKKTGGGL